MATDWRWIADLKPGESRIVPDTPAARMAVSYWNKRVRVRLRTTSLPNQQMRITALTNAITFTDQELTPEACAVLFELLEDGDDRREWLSDVHRDLTGEPLRSDEIEAAD